ncbi:hypothetical protein MNBD_UNCLBAC01-501 [hydrothermal vent metagenome]|uniref:Glycosyltransferase RgtA/B/C/D-like domain-containing protein n=1 Tax=hydrothermal vent metagenome TaxID=652676 RepID=A0A3B1DFY8_9ZZZZ
MGYLFHSHYYCIYCLEGCRIFKKILSMPISHLPTLMLLIGYPVFWLEMYVIRKGYGQTTGLAAGLFILVSLCVVYYKQQGILKKIGHFVQGVKVFDFVSKLFFGTAGMISLVILACVLYASLLPPHLIQESDALNYHITLPRQHLILESFQHIPWSTADLYLLPVNFALAPFWLVTELPNKFPQFLFLVGLVFVSVRLVDFLSQGNFLAKVLAVFVVLGSHIVGIQMGTAMLDIALCYLFMASIDSLLHKKVFLATIEFTFYFWAKSFFPIQMILIGMGLGTFYLIFKKCGLLSVGWNANRMFSRKDRMEYKKSFRKVIFYFGILSIFIGGPFVVKSLSVTGTPLYPFGVGMLNVRQMDKGSLAEQSLLENTEKVLATSEQYAPGRSLKDFIRHLWLIAVPEKGVNNRYDYPVGLVYLLCIGPFIWVLASSVRNRQFLIIPWLIVFFWGVWWMGSHQSRFLLIPILLMGIIILSQKIFQTKVFFGCVILSLALTSLSVFRAHRLDFGKSARDVLREKDKKLLEMSQTVDRSKKIQLSFFDAAFADFAVDVRNVNSVFVLKY